MVAGDTWHFLSVFMQTLRCTDDTSYSKMSHLARYPFSSLWAPPTQPTFKSPEMLAPAKMPVADGKKMENKPKKLPSGPRQLGTKFWAKMLAGGEKKMGCPGLWCLNLGKCREGEGTAKSMQSKSCFLNTKNEGAQLPPFIWDCPLEFFLTLPMLCLLALLLKGCFSAMAGTGTLGGEVHMSSSCYGWEVNVDFNSPR